MSMLYLLCFGKPKIGFNFHKPKIPRMITAHEVFSLAASEKTRTISFYMLGLYRLNEIHIQRFKSTKPRNNLEFFSNFKAAIIFFHKIFNVFSLFVYPHAFSKLKCSYHSYAHLTFLIQAHYLFYLFPMKFFIFPFRMQWKGKRNTICLISKEIMLLANVYMHKNYYNKSSFPKHRICVLSLNAKNNKFHIHQTTNVAKKQASNQQNSLF